MCELEKYMDELKENQPDESIGRALSEYAAIVSGVAEDYTDDVTEQELRQDHPELDFMDEDEIYEVLRQARLLRMRTDTQQNTITNQPEKKEEAKMCEFKSGIILKNRVVVAPGKNNSHTALLESIGMEDTVEKFIRAELLPPNEEWWTDIETWELNIDQDVLPDWYICDPEKYNDMFRNAVKEWCSVHVLVGREVEKLEDGYFLLKDSKVGELGKGAVVGEMRGNSVVGEMREDSIVEFMYENSKVGMMYDNSKVVEMHGNSKVGMMDEDSKVGEMYGNSKVGMMSDNSKVGVMRDNSKVGKMYGNSVVEIMYGNPIVEEMRGNSKVKSIHEDSTVKAMYGDSIVERMWWNSVVEEMHDNSIVEEMYGNSKAGKMDGNSIIKEMYVNSKVGEMRENSKVEIMRGKSVVEIMSGNSKVGEMYGNSKVGSGGKK